MNETEATAVLRAVLREVAPEVDLDQVGPDEDLTEGMDLDSIDFLNLVIGVHERTGLDIPERDYPKLATVRGWVAYLGRAPSPPVG